ncbi:MAG: VOC family protein [Pseudomonadota bacterium]
MAIIGLNHYNLRAPRELLDRLREFYCEVVGLELGQRPPLEGSGYWLYASGQDVLHLSQTQPGETRVTHVATTFDHVAFTCTGQPETETRLQRHNIQFETAHMPLTGKVQLFFKDPAGNGVELNFAKE